VRRTAAVAVLITALLGSAPVLAQEAGRDFQAEVALLYRVVACGKSDTPVPAEWTKVVDEHCREMGVQTARFRKRFVDRAIPFLTRLRPVDAPRTVVYPFGGGDLAGALVTYPEATEITTMSLEHAGDPTRLDGITPQALRRALADFRAAIRGLLALHDSTSDNLQKMQRGPLPGQISFFLTALAVFDYRPVSLRYFKLEPDGSVHYYTGEEIAALATTSAGKKKVTWTAADHSIAFSNSELVFERAAGGERVVHRHMAANLDDQHFKGSPVEKHLLAKGDVVAMTKAASYLLWMNFFSGIRDYLTAHAVYMVSDSTGVPPRHARQAGLKQVTYGKFTGPFLKASVKHQQAFIQMWNKQPFRRLGFRYGYPDMVGNFHLVITQREAAAATP